ncbi:MAG: hypothetical protein C0594_08540 [Marinilabiliales bacterium]|nr:MAG: hypothetical protein C0594_08540 [Marinilabiliales bacterium]
MLHENLVEELQLGQKFSLDLDEMNQNITEEEINQLIAIGAKTRQNIVGCPYPDKSFTDVSGNPKTIHELESEFVIINYNDLYTDICERELDSLITISKDMGEAVSIISFLPNSQSEISHLIEKYGNKIAFVTDANEHIKSHNLGQGSALNYILDHRREVIYASIHCSPSKFEELMK